MAAFLSNNWQQRKYVCISEGRKEEKPRYASSTNVANQYSVVVMRNSISDYWYEGANEGILIQWQWKYNIIGDSIIDWPTSIH